MLNDTSYAFLKRLLDAPGPSGFETVPARVWRAEASTFATVSGDVMGNSIAVVNPGGSPTIMLAGHIDEIGVIVTYVDDQGYAYVGPIGGWDPQVLVGQRVRFMGKDGDVVGVIGKKPIHLIKPDEREKASRMCDLWVDIGSTSKAETLARLSVGDAGVVDKQLLELPNGRIASRSIDNRIGAFVVLEALRRYAARPGDARVVAVATTQEEIAWRGGGALASAVKVAPAMAIVVDVTFATDHPGVDKKEHGEANLGGGPVLTRGSIVSPIVFNMVRDAAERLKIPYQLHAAGRESFTDADAIHNAAEGIATALVSVANRYMHSPSEMVAVDDLDRSAELIAETCRAVGKNADFTER
ncbi:peptidase M42 family protein [Gemmatirosa kalamazoonensis]|uniref:Peptidase M42 family protein n=1 Tax=Gemmatirosa kalamazoonensis TaxID=861299 RepID=W0RHT3_9BACT|nr:M20/M25/M40 family metallo-hydrolase [Gemmatirosa kalamazoonensis]AHG89987.1 peptidase M42 family protein [Gemmatirosa kalamazoonensis]